MQTYSTEFSSGLVEFDSNWQRIFVTALTFRLDQAIPFILFKGTAELQWLEHHWDHEN